MRIGSRLVLAGCFASACTAATPDAEPRASCKRAVEAMLAHYRLQPDSLVHTATPEDLARDVAVQIDNCIHRPWDDQQRRCFIESPDLAAAMICQTAGDRRRHPEWPWAPEVGR